MLDGIIQERSIPMIYTNQEKATIIAKYRRAKPIQEFCAKYGVCKRTITAGQRYIVR